MRPNPRYAVIAAGGTGGHLFPGLAVAEVLLSRECDVALLISPKEIDQQAVQSLCGIELITIPAVGLSGGNYLGFLRGAWNSYCQLRKRFRVRAPKVVLAMGGFTSAPPILAGKSAGAKTFLHESNSVPGRATRWLAPWVDGAFVGFASAGRRLKHPAPILTGTPVRPAFQKMEPASCRMALGLSPEVPVLLVSGGSQGATGINQAVIQALPALKRLRIQFLHLTGPNDVTAVREAYAAHGLKAVVRPFLTEMELALGAATLAVSRCGASSLAEFAAMGVPAILIPYPSAADDHQYYNARACERSGAAELLEQKHASPEHFAAKIIELLGDPARLERMRLACRQWHFPGAAEEIAQCLLAAMDPGPLYLPAADPTGAVAPRPAGPESHISTHSGAVI